MPGKAWGQAARQRAGAALERALDATHRLYETEGRGKVWRNHVPTRIVRDGARVAAGVGAVDYTGAVRPELKGPLVPVAFDVKVLGKGRTGYVHEPKQRHQLVELLEARRQGFAAFLLVEVRELGAAFPIFGKVFLRGLLQGGEVTLLSGPPKARVAAGWEGINYAMGFGYQYHILVPTILDELHR